LAGEQVLNDSFEVGALIVGLAPRAADFAEIIGDQINGLILIVRYDRGRPIGLTHQSNSTRYRTPIQAG
jgi:hypothetical protein